MQNDFTNESGIRRRTVSHAAAWTIPAIAVAVAAPAASASGSVACAVNIIPGMYVFTFTVTNGDPLNPLYAIGGNVVGGGLSWPIYPYVDQSTGLSVAPGGTGLIRLYTYPPVGTAPSADFFATATLYLSATGSSADATPQTLVESIAVPLSSDCVDGVMVTGRRYDWWLGEYFG